MVTVRQTITRALRKLRVIASGEEPTAAEAADGLAVVQGMVDAWASGGMFGRLTEYFGDASGIKFGTEATAWQVLESTPVPGDVTVTLPTRVRWPDGDEAPPPHMTLYEIVDDTGGTLKRFAWDARMGRYVLLHALTLDSPMPLATAGAEGMAALVATKLAEEFGAEIGPALVREAAHFKFNLSARYGDKRLEGQAVYF